MTCSGRTVCAYSSTSISVLSSNTSSPYVSYNSILSGVLYEDFTSVSVSLYGGACGFGSFSACFDRYRQLPNVIRFMPSVRSRYCLLPSLSTTHPVFVMDMVHLGFELVPICQHGDLGVGDCASSIVGAFLPSPLPPRFFDLPPTPVYFALLVKYWKIDTLCGRISSHGWVCPDGLTWPMPYQSGSGDHIRHRNPLTFVWLNFYGQFCSSIILNVIFTVCACPYVAVLKKLYFWESYGGLVSKDISSDAPCKA